MWTYVGQLPATFRKILWNILELFFIIIFEKKIEHISENKLKNIVKYSKKFTKQNTSFLEKFDGKPLFNTMQYIVNIIKNITKQDTNNMT